MEKMCIVIGMTVVGWIGWWLGSQISFAAGIFFSGVGSLLGVYVGWRISRDYLE